MLRILPHLLLAVSLFLTTVASTSVCSSAPYKDLLFLSSYAPAEILCSAVFPQPYITVTLTVGAAKAKRGGAHTNTKTTTTKHTTTTIKSPTSKSTTSTTPQSRCSECSVWSSCTAKGEAFLSTLCSCLEHPKSVTVKKTTSTSTSTSTSTTTSTTPSCTDAVISGSGCAKFTYTVTCGVQVIGHETLGTNTQATYQDCLNACDNENIEPGCAAWSFQTSTGTCTLYDSVSSTTVNADYDSGVATVALTFTDCSASLAALGSCGNGTGPACSYSITEGCACLNTVSGEPVCAATGTVCPEGEEGVLACSQDSDCASQSGFACVDLPCCGQSVCLDLAQCATLDFSYGSGDGCFP